MQKLYFAVLTNLCLLKALKDMSHAPHIKDKHRLQETKNLSSVYPLPSNG